MTASLSSFARWPLSLMALAVLAGCGDTATLAIEQGTGPNPQLPEPVKRLIPTVKIAPVKRWAANAKPTAADDLQVNAFARDLDHPRWLYVLPNGDVLVAETAEPPKPDDADSGGGLRKKVQGAVMKKAGAAVPSANRITLLRDADGDGVAEVRTQFISGLYSPFGMALVGDRFYVANADALVSFPYTPGDTHITAKPTFVANLPGGLNHHWTKSLLASPDGSKLYVGVGSNSNVAERGMEAELNRAAILEIDPTTGSSRVFAGGLRNPVGTAWEPGSKTLWTVVNERDEIGSDLVPDYLTSVRDGGFYGWPYSYYGQHVDERVQPQNAALVATAIKPDYALGPHTASLGLAFAAGTLLPERFRQGAFVGQHGSWNRDPPSGYKVIFVPFVGGKPSGTPITVLDGFLDAEGNAQGRPVGVALDNAGALLVADDVGNVIWRATPKAR
ncbi:sorbosone dehydrogenase family protein [Xanthomonas melonis]|uniref:Sorbosone dehydrogenase n=1 Tax=Xanthomonas melonis TaxID=56456 RepID=A0A2S7DMG6_9XANT|nr:MULTISPECIES: sorbosone dehydrogenase family protein [Xanthomonas]MCC4586018.1 sorbosone dehydrogenase family protein [Xanthomonas sp. NCPPB 1067]MCC4602162.1 sorbosone dehydrogenase family protein [Xanthomonas melonis]MCD0246466.1 sorbosone dehydrogenase family protein [Xanthomonas melonis]MCD0260517.1 sorbosone dehydrogenase family protein [Xanthomonas melonis]MCD0268573.1 sorbosone dehydrogenase family protein [Xanthomonas melonis]